jgi:Predicted transcriptional regulators
MQINHEALATLLAYKRNQEGLSLRDLAAQTGVSASTLSRIETGTAKNLDADHLFVLVDWLGVDFSLIGKREYRESAVATITTLLHDDPKLTKKNAAIISKMLMDMYAALAT